MTNTRPDFTPQPITLSSDKITLRPLTLDDSTGFYNAGNFPQLWQWVIPNRCESLAAATQWIKMSLEEQARNQHVPFVIVDNASNKIIGSTRYCTIVPEYRHLEIGYTFITPEFQRTHVNTQAKYLLLKHAFEQLGAVRVSIRTNENNQQSRNAIARIGGKFEGILRNHRVLSDGTLRNTAMFSIIEQEWPAVKTALENKLNPVTATI